MKLTDVEPIINKWKDYESYAHQPDYDCGFDAGIYNATLDLINAPTVNPLDVLGICRCKDCVHFRHNIENEPYCVNRYGLNDPEETDYCPYAKRKE